MSIKLIRLSEKKPPANNTVLFVWWHRNGIKTSQKTLGFINEGGKLILDVTYAGSPSFWCDLFSNGISFI